MDHYISTNSNVTQNCQDCKECARQSYINRLKYSLPPSFSPSPAGTPSSSVTVIQRASHAFEVCSSSCRRKQRNARYNISRVFPHCPLARVLYCTVLLYICRVVDMYCLGILSDIVYQCLLCTYRIPCMRANHILSFILCIIPVCFIFCKLKLSYVLQISKCESYYCRLVVFSGN